MNNIRTFYDDATYLGKVFKFRSIVNCFFHYVPLQRKPLRVNMIDDTAGPVVLFDYCLFFLLSQLSSFFLFFNGNSVVINNCTSYKIQE